MLGPEDEAVAAALADLVVRYAELEGPDPAAAAGTEQEIQAIGRGICGWQV